MVHTWLLEERIAEDRKEHARLPRLLAVVGCWVTPALSCVAPLLDLRVPSLP